MLTLNDGRSELWQWDTGRTLDVDADCTQVHFSNNVFGRSIDVDVVGGVAIIPDILLQTDKDLNVWAFVGTAENGYTKISKTFHVNRRNKPSDYVFTPVEQTTIDEIAAIAQSVRDDADSGLFDGKPGENGRDGVDGKDGTSATHSWNGTVLTITSASGTSSADLKGDKGDKGEHGLKGETGPTGPQGEKGGKGDPFTYADFTEEQLASLKGPKGDTGDVGPQGPKGDKGDTGATGPAGSDANVTAENIRSALGYTPANKAQLDEKITAPATAAVGQIIRVKTVDNNGKPTKWEAADGSMPPPSEFNLYEIDTDGCFLRNVLGRWCLVPGEIKSLEDYYKRSEAWDAYNSYNAQLPQISENLSALQSKLEAAQAELEARKVEMEEAAAAGEDTAEYELAVLEAEAAVARAQEALDAETEHYNSVLGERDNAYALYENTSYAKDVFDGELNKPFLLPHVTAADNGKTLQVVDGKWALV